MKLVSKDPDELAEIHTLIGDIVKYSLGLVALVFDVPDFHVQFQVSRYLA